MKEKLLTNWTFTRFLYLLMGIVILIQAILIRQWFGIALGGYFAAMGLFAVGCASGSCFSGNCNVDTKEQSAIQDVEFEEIKK